MRIAVLSDVHGNRHALEAVLADIDRQRVDWVYCLGDLVGYGANPNEVIEIIRRRRLPTVMGNYDEGVGYDMDDCGCAYTTPAAKHLGDLSLKWTREHVTADNKAFLRSLLPSIRFEVVGKRALLVHGSPRKINEYVYETRPQYSLEHIARSAQADLLIFGHTHLPYVKQVAGVLFVNDGSVGKPKDGDVRAAYALVELDGAPRAAIRRVEYDVAAAAAAVRASGLPPEYATMLETAQG